MKQLFQRLFEPTPLFFQIIRNLGASVVAFATLIITLQTQGYVLPVWVTSSLNFYTLSGGAITTFISQLASTWRNSDGTINEEKKQSDLEKKEV